MISIGNMQLNHPQSFIEARNKIRVVAELFTDDAVLPIRLATATSQICRSLGRQSMSPVIGVHLDDAKNQTVMVLAVEDSDLAMPSERFGHFFDTVKKGPRSDGTRLVNLCKRLCDTPPGRDVIARARTVLGQSHPVLAGCHTTVCTGLPSEYRQTDGHF